MSRLPSKDRVVHRARIPAFDPPERPPAPRREAARGPQPNLRDCSGPADGASAVPDGGRKDDVLLSRKRAAAGAQRGETRHGQRVRVEVHPALLGQDRDADQVGASRSRLESEVEPNQGLSQEGLGVESSKLERLDGEDGLELGPGVERVGVVQHQPVQPPPGSRRPDGEDVLEAEPGPDPNEMPDEGDHGPDRLARRRPDGAIRVSTAAEKRRDPTRMAWDQASVLRIALFCPYLPVPPTSGGRMRMFELSRRVAERAELHLFTMASGKERRNPEIDPLLATYAWHRVAPYPHLFLPEPGLPTRAARGTPRSNLRAFAEAHRARRFDLVWVEHVYGARAALGADLPWLLDEHNVESDFLAGSIEARGPVGALGRWAVATMRAFEQKAWRAASRIVCVTEADADHIAAFSPERPDVIPNGVAIERVPLVLPSARRGAEVLFVGRMDHSPNQAAAHRLVERIMPQVWARAPQATLVLCGANPPARVAALRGPRVEVTGTIPSVEPYLRRARVFANPLSHGAGSSLKVVEALAAGIPLVSTAVGVRGFPLEDGVHYRRAETDACFAARLLEGLRGDTPDSQAASGREVAEAHAWSRLTARFWSRLEETASR